MFNTRLLDDAARRSCAYLENIGSRAVAPSPEAIAALGALDGPLPDAPTEARETLALLDAVGSPATVATVGPRYFGYVVGGALDACVAASWLAAAWDQNANMVSLSPAACAIERVAATWLLDVLGLPASAHCAFVTGTTTAHITALTAARDHVLANEGWLVRERGLFGAPAVRVLVGGEAHPSLLRALNVVGFGTNGIERVGVDADGRMRAEAIPKLDGPAIVCAQAGNVNTGACDSVADIRRAAPDAWLHVDGAFGLWANASPKTRHLTVGIEEADSWATDGHKWLNVPYDSGMAIVRDRDTLSRALAMRAPYLIQERRDPMDYTLEMSRRARGIEVWAALRTLGRQGVAELVERCCAHAQRFAVALSAAGLTVLNDVTLNQVMVAAEFPEVTEAMVAEVQQDGTCWCGGTRWREQMAMRISVSSWATSEADVDRSVEAIVQAWRRSQRIIGSNTSRGASSAMNRLA